MAVMENNMIMPWSPWSLLQCSPDDVVPNNLLLISTQVVVRYFFLTRTMLNELIRNYPKDSYWDGSLSQKIEITKNNQKL